MTTQHHHHHQATEEKMTITWLPLIFLVLILQAPSSHGWFFSSSKEDGKPSSSSEGNRLSYRDSVSEFSMEPFKNERGVELVKNARNKMISASPRSCWQEAYHNLFAGCSKTLADEETRNRFAWHLTDCFLKHSGRPNLPRCDKSSPVGKCLKSVDQDSVKVYLEYHLQTNSICHQLQIEAFRHQTERLVNELKKSAEYAEEKLGIIEEQGDILLQNSKSIHDSLSSIDARAQHLSEASKNLESHVNEVFSHTKAVYDQSKAIAASQVELSEGQLEMKKNLDSGMNMLHESYSNLGQEIMNLKDEAVEIEKEIGRVGNAMFSKMDTLQNKADDIGNMAESSIEKQQQLLSGQSQALDGLHLLTDFQSSALEESRATLQKLADFGHRQQEELLEKQEQLQKAHDHLVENSKTILAAQEAFESKQASMFMALEKLFALHNAMLVESRLIKAFLVYSLAFFLLYMLTSTKQTYSVRHRVYIGLSVALLLEFGIIRWTNYNLEKQGWMIDSLRSISAVLVLIQLGYAVYSYRDFEVLNHQILLTLMDKVSWMQKGKHIEEDDDDDDIDWAAWVDSDLSEDVDALQDPDYIRFEEEVGENSIVSKRYNLRNRQNSIK